MFPYFDFLGKEIAMYSIMAAAGIISSFILVCFLAKKRNLPCTDSVIMLFAAFIGAYLGGAFLYALTQWRLISYLLDNLQSIIAEGQFYAFLQAVFGGSVFYGGLLGGIAAGALYLKSTGKSIGMYSDLAAAAVPLFHFFGRIGCFFGGCCYGIEYSWGFVFTDSPVYGVNGVKRFPVQLAEAGFELIIFCLILFMFLKKIQSRRLFLWYLLIYSSGRFLLEFLRGDQYRGFIGVLSTSQFISVFLFAAALTLLIKANTVKGAENK